MHLFIIIIIKDAYIAQFHVLYMLNALYNKNTYTKNNKLTKH